LDGKLFFCNPKYLEYKEFSHERFEDITFDDISNCEHKFESIKSRILLESRPFILDRQEKESKIWFRSTFYRIHNSYIVHKCEDITDDIIAKEKLKQSSIFFENANEGILITDANAKILSVNKAFSKITGYHLSEVREKHPLFYNQVSIKMIFTRLCGIHSIIMALGKVKFGIKEKMERFIQNG